MSSSSRAPALDGIRGLAILLVVVYHHTLMRQESLFDQIYVNTARLGWIGVDLFFVLSGFLITGLLFDAKGAPHYFRNFYARRMLRIFPVYYAFLAFTLHLAPALWPDTETSVRARNVVAEGDAVWYWLYLQNVLFARLGDLGLPNLAVTWSLAIEEQFYVVWPFVVALAGRRALMWTCGLLVIAALIVRVVLVTADVPWVIPYTLPLGRMDALAAGAFVALAIRGRDTSFAIPRWLRSSARGAAPVAAAVFLAIWCVEDALDDGAATEPLMLTAGVSALAIGFAALVVLTLDSPAHGRLRRFFSLAPLRSLGTYSYALYLFHVPVRRFIRDSYFPVADFPTWLGSALPGQLLFYVVATAPALLLAWLSWHLFEKQLLKLRRHFPYDRGAQASSRSTGPA